MTWRWIIPVGRIERAIRSFRGERVLLDSDFAEICGVSTKRLDEQVQRNGSRFPEDFMFYLTDEDADHLRSQIATAHMTRSSNPFSTQFGN